MYLRVEMKKNTVMFRRVKTREALIFRNNTAYRGWAISIPWYIP
jgi:hypothetical protein